MKINCIIIDDTPLAVEKLESFILQVPSLNLLRSFNKAMDALSFLKDYQVDLIFLDIQMEELSGFQFLNVLKQSPKVIIVSAYSKYALEGFNYNVKDYLLKPYSFERFIIAVEKVQSEIGTKYPKEYIFIKTEYRMERVDFCDILYIEGKGAYLRIITNKKGIMTLLSFDQIEKILPEDNFIRIHKSYVIAFNKVESIERNRVKIGDQLLPVGLNFREKFYNSIKMSGQ